MGDYVKTSTDRHLEESFKLLAATVSKLEGRIDVESVDKEEFAELFKSCYLVLVRTNRAERRKAAVNLIANILLAKDDPARLSYTELDHFVRCLDMLSIGALRCVALIYKDIPDPPTRVRKTIEFGRLANQLSGFDSDLLMGLLGELSGLNLVHLTGRPGIPTQNYGNYPIELNSLGARFVHSVMTWRDVT